jgi:chromosome segregation ATPase
MSRVQTHDTVLANLASQGAASEPTEEKSEVEKDKDGGESKPKKTAQERIQELAAKRKEAEADAEAARREAAELKARLQALSAQATPLEDSGKPLRSQFATDDEYIEALADFKAKQAIAKREQEQAQARAEAEEAELASTWNRRQEQVMKALPDYAEVVAKSEVSVPPHVYRAILESDQGPQLNYYLCLHPEEAKRIAQMPPIRAIKHLTALERDLAAIEQEEEAVEVDKDKPKPQKSKAPPPIDLPKSTPSATPSTTNSYEEYKRRRQAEQRK